MSTRIVRLKRQRTQKIFIDSRDLVSHENNNPSRYTYNLNETISNVVKARLLSFRVPYSPTFIVIRSSDWFAAGTTLAMLGPDDYVHKKAVELKQLINAKTVEKSDVVATIYKADGTVSLNVIEVFTFDRVEDPNDPSSRFRSYDIFICTGALFTSERTNWFLQHPQSTDPALADLPMASPTADASIAVNILEENMYLNIRMGQGHSRLTSIRSVYPLWKSFQVYRRGDIAYKDGVSYTCLVNHMSLIFNEDVGVYWQHVEKSNYDVGAADDTFYVMESNDPNESVILATAGYDEIVQDMAPSNVSTIEIEWKTRRGSHYIFPHTTAIDFLSFTDTVTPAILRKEYRHHTLLLELVYEEETEVMASGDVTAGSINATPNFLSQSSSPLRLQAHTTGRGQFR